MSDRQSRVDHFNAGAAGRDDETGYERDQRAPARALYGSKDMERLFPGQIPRAGAPWPSAGRRKNEPKFDQAAVTAELERSPRTVDIDPRILSAGQPHVTRAGVEHYMSGKYEQTGETFADQHNVGNQFPFVVTKPRPTGGHEHLIISGHHRATAALLQGRKLTTRWVEQ
ncbi:MAG TPA: hypothetical protein VFI41_05300 [Gemmatimonadales bacterium]|nr:hypothetical protein [Gemmatimonadales bacterium]